ncbi:hypothetical protein GCM10010328_66510 [Streptomyces rubiginosohelvolus]|uniref:DUF427 domain-containing protein n=1 Tax=Streptomyces rubiginosohelvolus TaxID=67362 RepID=A0ABQ3CBR6_9ACTN|nr:hypothetical protein GCM10010328_66510 [Streptomyces pluricolorescens]
MILDVVRYDVEDIPVLAGATPADAATHPVPRYHCAFVSLCAPHTVLRVGTQPLCFQHGATQIAYIATKGSISRFWVAPRAHATEHTLQMFGADRNFVPIGTTHSVWDTSTEPIRFQYRSAEFFNESAECGLGYFRVLADARAADALSA